MNKLSRSTLMLSAAALVAPAGFAQAPDAPETGGALEEITVTAQAASRVYGDTNPAFGYTVGGLGLAAGDTASGVFSGTLGSTANTASGVGNYLITQGTLAANPLWNEKPGVNLFVGVPLVIGSGLYVVINATRRPKAT